MDLYKTLGVDRSAPVEVIEAAFRALSKKHHPDKNPTDPRAGDRFRAIFSAYETLRDPARRAVWDRAHPPSGDVRPPSPPPPPSSRSSSPPPPRPPASSDPKRPTGSASRADPRARNVLVGIIGLVVVVGTVLRFSGSDSPSNGDNRLAAVASSTRTATKSPTNTVARTAAKSSPTPRATESARPSLFVTPEPSTGQVSMFGIGADYEEQIVTLFPGTWTVRVTDSSDNHPVFRGYAYLVDGSRVLIFDVEMEHSVEFETMQLFFAGDVRIAIAAPAGAGTWSVLMWQGSMPTPTSTPRPSPTATADPGVSDRVSVSGNGLGFVFQMVTLQPGTWEVSVTDNSGNPVAIRGYIFPNERSQGTLIFDIEVKNSVGSDTVEVSFAGEVKLSIFASAGAGTWSVSMRRVS